MGKKRIHTTTTKKVLSGNVLMRILTMDRHVLLYIRRHPDSYIRKFFEVFWGISKASAVCLYYCTTYCHM